VGTFSRSTKVKYVKAVRIGVWGTVRKRNTWRGNPPSKQRKFDLGFAKLQHLKGRKSYVRKLGTKKDRNCQVCMSLDHSNLILKNEGKNNQPRRITEKKINPSGVFLEI